MEKQLKEKMIHSVMPPKVIAILVLIMMTMIMAITGFRLVDEGDG